MSRLRALLAVPVTPLAAYGLVILFVLFGGIGLSWAFGQVQQIKKQTQSAYGEYVTLTQIQNTNVWEERLAKSLAAKELTDEAIWSGTTNGVIAASVQQALDSISQSMELQNGLVQVTARPDEIDGIFFMKFNFRGGATDWASAIDVLSALASDSKSIIPTEITFSDPSRGLSQMRISGLVPIQIVEEQVVEEQVASDEGGTP